MRVTLRVAAVAAFLLGWTLTARPASARPAGGLEVKLTQNTQRLMPYQVFEITFQHEGKYHSPTWDVTIDVTLTSPTGKKVKVGGFYYGPSRPPDEGRGARGEEVRRQKAKGRRQNPEIPKSRNPKTGIQHSAFSIPRSLEGPLCAQRSRPVVLRIRLPRRRSSFPA